ncbi:MAG: ArsR/SmtB family transcription factor [Acidimicrobiales bacterium]
MGTTTTGPGARLAGLRALADPTRLRIFRALRERERCVRDLVETEHLGQPLVSHHLGVLVRARLVQARRHDGFTLYALDAAGMAALAASVADLLDPVPLAAEARPGGNPACCR